MFVGAGIRLDVGFNTAQARLTNLVRGGLLRRASGGAYDDWQASLARVEPRAAALGMSKLVQVRFRDGVIHGNSAVWAMRWKRIGPGRLVVPGRRHRAQPGRGRRHYARGLRGYRPPLGALGAGLDRAIMHRVAEATIRIFTDHIGDSHHAPGRLARSRRWRDTGGSLARAPDIVTLCHGGPYGR